MRTGEPQKSVVFDRQIFALGCVACAEHDLLAIIADQSLCLYSLPDFQAVEAGAGHGGKVDYVAISPDKSRIVSAGGGSLKLWQDDDARPVWSKPMQVFGTLAVSPDGESILVTDSYCPTRLSAGDGSQQFRSTECATTSVFGADTTFHLRYDEVLEETIGSRIHLFGGEPLEEIATGKGPYFRCVPLMDAQAKFGVFYDDGTLYGWDLRQMEELWQVKIDSVDVALSDDARWVAVKSFGELVLLDAASGEKVGEVVHDQLVYALAFSPDASYLAVPVEAEDGTCSDVQIYRLVERTSERVILSPVAVVETGHSGNVTAATFSADGRIFVTGGADGTVELHELELSEA